MTVASGTRLGHYTIISPLGAGGMGEVWLAEDTTLKRKVALKVLPAGVATDPDHLARFQREAEAIAALSHPNIVTIHSIEQDGDVRFLTMERVEGQSLDQVIPRGGLPLGQVLEIGATLADALAASHEKGIIHRDLKPANIMLAGRERRVKVLDFGLAKLREEAAADGETTTAALSGEGRILGTVAYMSPEQAEGKPVDARSDLFSLGIVLYELATGERPFKGETSISVLSAILRDTPRSVTDLRADLPKEFARIIRQCLQKDPEARYQTAKDLRNQLRALKADLDSGDIAVGGAGVHPETVPRRRRLVRWLAVGVGAVALLAVTALFAQRFGMFSRVPPSRPFETITLKKLTDTGKVVAAAISPDGRYLAYSQVDERNRSGVWVRQIQTGSDVAIVPPDDRLRRHAFLRFSSDSAYVYYAAAEADGDPRTLYRVPTFGGAPQRVADDVSRGSARLSPDGARLVFLRERDNRFVDLLVAQSDGGNERRVATGDRKALSASSYLAVDWSPDGRSVTAMEWRHSPGGATTHHVVSIDPESGREAPLGQLPITPWPPFTWLPGGEGFLVTGLMRGDGRDQIWLVTYPALEAHRVTHDLARYQDHASSMSVTADGRRVVALQGADPMNIWIVDPDDPSNARPITASLSGQEGLLGIDWTPDGELVCSSVIDGAAHIWTMKADGSGRRQLTSGAGRDASPAVSPDGRSIAFGSRTAAAGEAAIWLMDRDGGHLRRLTASSSKVQLDPFRPLFFAPDGQWVRFGNLRRLQGFDLQVIPWNVSAAGDRSLALVDPTGEREARGAVPPGFRGYAPSPDGNWIAGMYGPETPAGSGRRRFALVSADGTQRWRDLKSLAGVESEQEFCWTPDSRSITRNRMEFGASTVIAGNLWLYPIDGSEPRQLTRFASLPIRRFAWSRDGKRLAVSRSESTSDAVLITSVEKK